MKSKVNSKKIESILFILFDWRLIEKLVVHSTYLIWKICAGNLWQHQQQKITQTREKNKQKQNSW